MDYNWKWQKLPDDKKKEMLQYYRTCNWFQIMMMHNEYELSPVVHCCCDDCVKSHVRSAIEKGVLK